MEEQCDTAPVRRRGKERSDVWWKRAAVLGTWLDAVARLLETVLHEHG